MPILIAEVAQASFEPRSTSLELIRAFLKLAVVMVQSPSDSMESDEESVGSEVMFTIHESFDFKGVHQSCPTIRDLVGDFDKSKGNSKEWMLKLRDGWQIVLPLSLY